MGADLFVRDTDNQSYLDDPLSFVAEHGERPSVDVIWLRDDGEYPRHIRDKLYQDEIPPEDLLLLRDSLLRQLERRGGDERALQLASWLDHWAKRDEVVKGIH